MTYAPGDTYYADSPLDLYAIWRETYNFYVTLDPGITMRGNACELASYRWRILGWNEESGWYGYFAERDIPPWQDDEWLEMYASGEFADGSMPDLAQYTKVNIGYTAGYEGISPRDADISVYICSFCMDIDPEGVETLSILSETQVYSTVWHPDGPGTEHLTAEIRIPPVEPSDGVIRHCISVRVNYGRRQEETDPGDNDSTAAGVFCAFRLTEGDPPDETDITVEALPSDGYIEDTDVIFSFMIYPG